jgi:hypothetical protein
VTRGGGRQNLTGSTVNNLYLVTSAGAKIAFASLIAMIVNVLYSEMLEIELFLDLLTG